MKPFPGGVPSLLFRLLLAWVLATSVSTQGTTPDPRISNALRLTANGDLQRAESLYRALSQETPDQGFPLLGRFLFLTGSADAFQEMIDEIVSTPSFGESLLAKVYLQSGQPDKALRAVRHLANQGQDP
ncbi:MAG: hypothetical protein AAGJ31_13410, partial [Verrucomicrobiota bacterium]